MIDCFNYEIFYFIMIKLNIILKYVNIIKFYDTINDI